MHTIKTPYHIIPDIHGQADKLNSLLRHLGWRRTPAGWAGPDPHSRIMFLGDFIDRGPENARVIHTVRSLLDSGKADAVMGNHEFNSILFHTEVEGHPLRERSAKNLKQHRSFLDEFPIDSRETREAIDWMKTLPLFIDNGLFRAVHACWHHESIDLLQRELPEARITDDHLLRESWTSGPLWNALEIVTKGIEEPLPEGYSFHDKDGHERHDVRIGWWLSGGRTWRDVARSVPDRSALPANALPNRIAACVYTDPTPVFFGHYWMTGDPVVEAANALCLDYSAGKSGPLIAYSMDERHREMDRARIVLPDASGRA